MWCVDLCRVHYLFQDQEMQSLFIIMELLLTCFENNLIANLEIINSSTINSKITRGLNDY